LTITPVTPVTVPPANPAATAGAPTAPVAQAKAPVGDPAAPAAPAVVADTLAPTAPADVMVVSADSSTVTLSWIPSTDDVGVAGYEVWSGSTKHTASADTTTMISELAPNTSYAFRVIAVDAAGTARRRPRRRRP
jgi:hypothetical protein